MKVLVTGCNGYIGSHAVKALAESGHEIHGLDRVWPERFECNDVDKYLSQRIEIDILDEISCNEHYDAVIHLAAAISVEESVRIPTKYYLNNVQGTLNVVDRISTDHFIFGSTGGAFNPTNPYSRSKIMAEDLVKERCKDYTIFRFFNVAGSNGEFRQWCPPSHIIRIAAMVAAGKKDRFIINGSDYATNDGTCLRDYVHVQDIADSLVYSLDKPANTDYECLSTNVLTSNLEVAVAMQNATGKSFSIEYGPRRVGDPEIVTSPVEPSSYFNAKRNIEDMCYSAYRMEM